ncbi:glycoside hydrolase family 3 N-terminal domain-containing protein [Streptomyces sp. M19]
MQRHVLENTRLGIPVLMVEEVPHGHQAPDGTVLPVNLAVGATWNPDLYEAASAVAAAELRARGGHVALVSALDLVRDPRWGRAEECFGEDPYLAARFTEALVRGMQGRPRGPSARTGRPSCSNTSPGRAPRSAAATGPRPNWARGTPRDPPRRRPRRVRAGAAGVMAAYNEFDGLPCAASHGLLTELLRDRWGTPVWSWPTGRPSTGSPGSRGRDRRRGARPAAGTDVGLWDDGFPGWRARCGAGWWPRRRWTSRWAGSSP